jgi:hypothetical protein
MLAARIYQMIYHPETVYLYEKQKRLSREVESVGPKTIPEPSNTVHIQGSIQNTQRTELERALRELQSRPNKTLSDRTSIEMIQAALRNL